MESLDELEGYLRHANVLSVATFPLHGAHPSFRVTLEGGVAVLAKPVDATPDAAKMVPREVAAWIVARALGWSDLLAATVLREVPGIRETESVAASLQVLWPDFQPDAPLAVFRDDDVWRAAVFDVLIAQTDRSGHNWLAVPPPGAEEESRLKLVDHGYAFDFEGRALASSFFAAKRGQPIPADVKATLARLVDEWPPPGLADLLEPEALTKLERRARRLASADVLQHEE